MNFPPHSAVQYGGNDQKEVIRSLKTDGYNLVEYSDRRGSA